MKKEDKKLGQELAFPLSYETTGQYGEKFDVCEWGMSKRFYAACSAMQGLLANPDINRFGSHGGDKFDVIAQSYKFADKLLEREYE